MNEDQRRMALRITLPMAFRQEARSGLNLKQAVCGSRQV
jgi:hypothetical protein